MIITGVGTVCALFLCFKRLSQWFRNSESHKIHSLLWYYFNTFSTSLSYGKQLQLVLRLKNKVILNYFTTVCFITSHFKKCMPSNLFNSQLAKNKVMNMFNLVFWWIVLWCEKRSSFNLTLPQLLFTPKSVLYILLFLWSFYLYWQWKSRNNLI